MKTGDYIKFKKSEGSVLAFYKNKKGYNLNIKGKTYTDSYSNLTEEEVCKIKHVPVAHHLR